jgi:hypothetical protein
MRIGYGKIGRTIGLTPQSWGVVGGDDEAPLLLKTLAERWPEHTFVLLGRNSGEVPQDVGFPPNVENPFINLRGDILNLSRGNHSPMTLPELYRSAPGLIQVWAPVFDTLDHVIMWQGQHGTSNYPIPKTDGSGEITRPQDAFVYYVNPMIGGINRMMHRDPHYTRVVWLCADPRNLLKARDLAWPPQDVLGQFEFTKKEKHWRYDEPGDPKDFGFTGDWVKSDRATNTWHVDHKYVYSQLEICGILPEHVNAWFSDDFHGRDRFGLFINEARAYVKNNRRDAFVDYVLPLNPDFVHGKWSEKSQEQITALGGPIIEPAPAEVYYDKLRSVKCTLTTPSSGSGWATTKPWQSFATGTVCFFHPEYDTQGHIIPTLNQIAIDGSGHYDEELATLAKWLRVEDPEQLHKRVDIINSSYETWLWLARTQRVLYDKACQERRILNLIGERLGI